MFGFAMAVQFASTSHGLVLRLSAGVADPESWERFVYTYGPQIVQWVRDHGLQDADAQDVAQEVLLRISRQITRMAGQPPRSFRGWLHAVVHGAWADWVESRTARRWSRKVTLSPRDPAPDLLAQIPAREDLLSRLEACYDRELFDLAADRVRKRVSSQTWEAFERLALWRHTSAEVSRELALSPEAALAARCRVQRLLREEVQLLEQHD